MGISVEETDALIEPHFSITAWQPICGPWRTAGRIFFADGWSDSDAIDDLVPAFLAGAAKVQEIAELARFSPCRRERSKSC